MRNLRPLEPLGDILIRSGIVTGEQVERALERQRVQPGRFGSHLLELGMVTEDDLAKSLSMQHRVPAFIPSLCTVQEAAVGLVSHEMVRKLRVMPVAWDPPRGVLQVVMADPTNLAAADEVRFASGARRLAVQVAPESVIERLIAQHYEGVEPDTRVKPTLDVAGASLVTSRRARRGSVLVGDPDAKRRRAFSGLLEGLGFAVTRARTSEEVQALLDEKDWNSVWVHVEWAEGRTGDRALVYDDPVLALEDYLRFSGRLVGQTSALVEDAAKKLLRSDFLRVRQAVGLVRFLAGRQGLKGLAAECLEVRAWRTALAGWQVPDDPGLHAGDEILAAVAAYQRAVRDGQSPTAAAEALRSAPDLDAGAVTSLLRWSVGADLLRQIEAPRSLLALFPVGAEPTALLDHLAVSGWTVETSTTPDVDGEWDVVLAALEQGLAFLEAPSKAGNPPPVFVLAPNPSEPDVMYALRLGAEDVLTPGTHLEVMETKLARAAARRHPASGLVTGNLRDMGLADLLQILSNGLKTAVLRIEAPHGRGEIALLEGQIADARTGDRVGEEALYAMVGWDEGTFRIEPDVRTREVTIQGSTDGLLMEGFRRLDEARRTASEEVP